nr:lysozyme inhibitor LprI family protein [Lysobacter chinensis]
MGAGSVPTRAGADDIDCAQASATMEIDICMSREYERADVELNTSYKRLRAQLQRFEDEFDCAACTGMSEMLVEAQRHWIAFRDRDCDAVYAHAADGSGRNQALLECLIEHTRTRTRQLDRRIEPAG